MRNAKLLGWAVLLTAICFPLSLQAGEPLVFKSPDGKYVPAVATQWTKTGAHSFRFLLRSGTKAVDVANELKSKLAPNTVRATDEITLVIEGKGLQEEALLDKLSAIQLASDKPSGDSLAALAGLGNEGGPMLADPSSAGSIRVNKQIELKSVPTPDDPHNLVGKVIRSCACDPMPTLEIQVISAPKAGPYRRAFQVGKVVSVRGYYKLQENDTGVDAADPRTQANLQSKDFVPGDQIFGKPIDKNGEQWIIDVIVKK
jgi:hypothetical protein